MTKKTRYEVYALAVLLVVLPVVWYAGHAHDDVFTGVHAADDGKFEPLDVPDPSLRLDLLTHMQSGPEYNGQHRNIFSEEPLPPPPAVVKAQKEAQEEAQKVPATPPPPPPLTVPATFYGIVTDPATGQRRACFSNTDNIYVLSEGATLLNQFRVVKIGNNTVDVEEISSGRSTTLTLPQPGTGGQNAPQMGQQ
ncbi:MAG TPA: hypothetical protein VKB26_13855 [Candidatus Acidoferrales bacterium]|nr:hypothetical protein [Candidatus Acidoferrales bacterium]